jgi:hypothetical protein
MAQIFDQDQPKSTPKSTLAQSLNAAFAGCEQWTLAPPRRRSMTLPPPKPRGQGAGTPRYS